MVFIRTPSGVQTHELRRSLLLFWAAFSALVSWKDLLPLRGSGYHCLCENILRLYRSLRMLEVPSPQTISCGSSSCERSPVFFTLSARYNFSVTVQWQRRPIVSFPEGLIQFTSLRVSWQFVEVIHVHQSALYGIGYDKLIEYFYSARQHALLTR